MPHYKCVACRTRAVQTGRLGDPPIGDCCPRCGAPWEPVEALAEIVGFAEVTSSPGTVIPIAQSNVVAPPLGSRS